MELFAELLFTLDLLLLAGMFWATILRNWRVAGGLGVALVGTFPMLNQLLAGGFRLGALLVLIAAGLAGGGIAVAALLERRH